MRFVVSRACGLALLGAVVALGTGAVEPGTTPARWNPRAAEGYLERRADWWIQWPGAARDHDTVCVSCHTTLPYALARAALGGPESPAEQRIVDSIVARVRRWSDIEPYYANRPDDDRKSAESRGTESVLNALILASRDARTGRLTGDTRLALEHLWDLQQSDGGWKWLQFDLQPWEGRDSAYFGAALAARAVAITPPDYRMTAAVAGHVQRLQSLLASAYDSQPLLNRTALLWASATMPELIQDDRRNALVEELTSAQRHDGGWSIEAMMASRSIRSWLSPSDGYATGLATLALLPTSGRDSALRGVAWLTRHQEPADGSWNAASLNARRQAGSDAAPFMTDAATAFAVLALKADGQVR